MELTQLTFVVKDNGKRKLEFDETRLIKFIHKLFDGLKVEDELKKMYISKSVRQIKNRQEIDFKDINKVLIGNALELVDDVTIDVGGSSVVDVTRLGNTDFQHVAKRVLLNSLYKRASKNRSYNVQKKYGDFVGLVNALGEKGLYCSKILRDYTDEELAKAGRMIKPERDELLTYIGLHHMSERYIVREKDKSKSILELPQERYLMIALAVSRKEQRKNGIRMTVVKELYDALSTQKITMATPTFQNAGRPNAQMSSCFIQTVEDDLRDIYNNHLDSALISKLGGGIGKYYGKIRSKGSDIRGNKGVANGVIGWIKGDDNTAVTVDQLGMRAGSIAVYLDLWHKDIFDFLELRLNTGDLSKRAHSLFTGACIPDVFMRQVKSRGDWYLFDPHEVQQVMGFKLEDHFDAKKLQDRETPNLKDHAFTYRYWQCVDSNELSKVRVPAIDIMKKIMVSQSETGLPYMFYRDTVNRDNPNKHEGIIYSSNLCSEIAQNMSPSVVTEEILTDEGTIITTKETGDFVTCNLASLVLNNIIDPERSDEENDAELRHIIHVLIRAVDNVITVNNLPVKQAEHTNDKYRAVGMGEQGVVAVLAKQAIHYNSQEAIDFIADLEEKVMAFAIEASANLGKEKGSYQVFEGSEWNTGAWIESKETRTDVWEKYGIKEKSMEAMRNAWLRAVAPTGSTSILAGSTAGVDPLFDIIYREGKKDFKLPVVTPSLDEKTYWYYKPVKLMDYEGNKELGFMWSVLHNEARQPWVDQATSFNIYVSDEIGGRDFLRIHEEIWERGIKTSYYTRSHDADKDESCLACSS
jgi:ribonucleoside-diphosphate reductase alpha chain